MKTLEVVIEFSIYLLFLVFVLILVLIQRLRTWNANRKKPIISVHAEVIGRRTDGNKELDITLYYVTFQIKNGKQIELQMREADYLHLDKGNMGILQFQGTYFRGFQPYSKVGSPLSDREF